jgi:hypothetical protein
VCAMDLITTVMVPSTRRSAMNAMVPSTRTTSELQAVVLASAKQQSTTASTEPSEEVCDGVDNDCDGAVDDDLGTTWTRL